MALFFRTRDGARATASRREGADSFDSFVRFRTHVFQKLKNIDELRGGFACDAYKSVLEVEMFKCETTSVSIIAGTSKC